MPNFVGATRGTTTTTWNVPATDHVAIVARLRKYIRELQDAHAQGQRALMLAEVLGTLTFEVLDGETDA